jgi:endonuclease YncB( thermonuclease family)
MPAHRPGSPPKKKKMTPIVWTVTIIGGLLVAVGIVVIPPSSEVSEIAPPSAAITPLPIPTFPSSVPLAPATAPTGLPSANEWPGQAPFSKGPVPEDELLEVDHLVDGDTIDVKTPGTGDRYSPIVGGKPKLDVTRVRIIGINSPEVFGGEECWGKKASGVGQAEINSSHNKVKLETDASQGDKDRFGRALRHVITADGSIYAVSMAARGAAKPFVYNGHPSKYAEVIQRASINAKATNQGLWGTVNNGGCDGQATRYGN